MIRRAIVSFGCFVLMFCGSAYADIGEGLDSMFVATGNEPSIYQSQRRMGVDMGTFRLRLPMSRVNVVNITPPQLRGGCGGIDLYGGSFTFINGEQFRQILRQIGANALGYAFKLALASMCEKCHSVMTGLQAKIDELNRMQVDTCRWGAGLVNEFASAAKFKVNEDAKQDGVELAEVADGFEAYIEDFTSGDWLSKGSPTGADPTNENVGNITYNAIRISGIGDRFSFVPGNISHNELLMNIAGTFLMKKADSAGTEEGTTATPLGARLSYAELKGGKKAATGGENALPLLECDTEDYCLNPDDAGTWSFIGVDDWVEQTLQEAADHMADPLTAGTDHSPAIQNFLAQLPLTIIRHLQVLQGKQGALDAYIRSTKEYIAASYSSTLALSIVSVIKFGFSREDSPTMPEAVRLDLLEFERDAKQDQRIVKEKYSATWLETEELVAKLDKKFGDPGSRLESK